MPATEHGDLRAGHGTEATSPAEALVTVLSLECVMGPWNVATVDRFSSEDLARISVSRTFGPIVNTRLSQIFDEQSVNQIMVTGF